MSDSSAHRFRWAFLLVAAALAGCGTQGPTLRAVTATVGPVRAELGDTPFFPQEDFQCGPAALATVLAASGLDTTPDVLVPKVYLPGRRGSLQLEVIAAARQSDRLAYVLSPELSQVVAEVAAGRPVLVLQNLGLASYPVWHFAVVVGYDRDADTLLLRSGTTERLVLSTSKFVRTWTLAERWAMVVLQPGTMPAHPEAVPYLSAAAALEATGRLEAAAAAYVAGSRAWPDSPLPHLGLANVAFTRGDLVGAIQAYDEALLRDPGNVVARHNLAQALADLGCVQAARREIHRALELAGQTPFAGTVSAAALHFDAMANAADLPRACESR